MKKRGVMIFALAERREHSIFEYAFGLLLCGAAAYAWNKLTSQDACACGHRICACLRG